MVLNIVTNVVPSTTDRMVGNSCVADVLQYTVYAVMMPFFGMGGVQNNEKLVC